MSPSHLITLLSMTALVGALAPSSSAVAQETPSEKPRTGTVPPQPKTGTVPAATSGAVDNSDKFRLDVGVGVKGGLTGAWAFEVLGQGPNPISQEKKSYYPAFGLGGDVGLALDVRALGIVGIESGFRVSFDNAEGYNELKDADSQVILVKINQEQKTTSLRIPLLLKVGAAQGIVRPTFAFGLEFVRQTDSAISYNVEEIGGREASGTSARREARNQIEPTNYKVISGAFGVEIDAGPVKIPIELRAQYNLDYGGDSFTDRVRVDGDTYYYNGQYQGHFGVSVGLIYDLNLFL